jgi:flagellar basal-body rod protein FlgC
MASMRCIKRRFATLAAGDPSRNDSRGVHVLEIELDDSPPMMRYEPGSPFANEDGYVGYPNINPVIEQMNAMEAARSYEANITAIEATKSMMSVALADTCMMTSTSASDRLSAGADRR